MKFLRFLIIGIIGFCVLLSGRESSPAEKKFPIKPIQVIIPFSPGVTDSNLRPFIEKMREYLGQPMNITYKPGGGGALGAAFVASSKPDGYTLLGASQTIVVLVPLVEKNVGYTWDSFAPINCLAEGFLLFAVPPTSNWKNLSDFVAEAKKKPGQISYATGGLFDSTNIATRIFAEEAGIKLNMIPCKGGAAIVTAVLGGHVNAAATGLAALIPHIRAASLQALAVFNKKRAPAIPDVPTFSELGYSVELPSAYGLLAPRGTSPEIVQTIHLAAQKVVENHRATVNEQLNNLGGQIGFLGPAEYSALLKTQNAFFNKMISKLRP